MRYLLAIIFVLFMGCTKRSSVKVGDCYVKYSHAYKILRIVDKTVLIERFDGDEQTLEGSDQFVDESTYGSYYQKTDCGLLEDLAKFQKRKREEQEAWDRLHPQPKED